MTLERASTGIPGLDAAIDDLRIGDNVVWRVSDLADFRSVLRPFLDQCRRDGRRLVYVRFANHEPLLTADDGAEVHHLDLHEGFEPFAVAVHDLIAGHGRRAFYVFDCLTEMLDAWHSDLMVTNFFKVTCPFLYELDTIAYFALLRDGHTAATVAGIRDTTQVLLDLHVSPDAVHVHPLKVDGRSSPTMFFPHRLADGLAVPVTSSDAAARLSSPFGHLRSRPDRWQRVVDDAYAALDADDAAKDAASGLLHGVLIGPDGRMADLARRHLSLSDLLIVASRVVGTGRIGGKAVGMLLARAIVAPEFGERLEPHDSFHIGADVFYTFLVANGWWGLRLRQRDPAHFLDAGAELHDLIPGGSFPAEIVEQFRLMLEWYGQAPIIVRSSSLLEDNFGHAFAGKYDSFFLANQGSPEQRLTALLDAVRAIYASAMSSDALRYRAERGLADADEQMAILVQRVSGDHHGSLFFPHAAGVGNSSNLYTWDASMDADAGMLRLVIGLGTRAVDRTTTDHARIVALDDPLLGRLSDADDLSAFSQRRVDVLDLTAGAFATVPLASLVGTDIRAHWSLFTSPDAAALRRLAERGDRRPPGGPSSVGDRRGRRPVSSSPATDRARAASTGEVPQPPKPVVADFRGLLASTDFPGLMRGALGRLAEAYDYPVDVEFTVNLTAAGEPHIGIVQCRPLQTRGPGSAVEMPSAVDPDDVLFASTGEFMGGNVRLPLEYVVSVLPDRYLSLGVPDRHGVARLIGALNRALAGRSFALLGPGRWGTTTEALGVPVRFAEISRASALLEATDAAGGFRPELSYGSHFFQDLVETGIFYAAIFDDRPGVTFNPALVTSRPNEVTTLVPDAEPHLVDVVHVARFDDLELFSDITTQQVVCTRTREGPAEIDQAYERAYAKHPVDEPDEWGDLASFGEAVRAAGRTGATDVS